MEVKSHGRLVFGVDDDREDRRIAPARSNNGVHHERRSEALSDMSSVNGKSDDRPAGKSGYLGKRFATPMAISVAGMLAAANV